MRILQLTPPEQRGAGPESYAAVCADGSTRWEVQVDLGSGEASPFREEAPWADAGVAAIGGKGMVVLLDLATGAERARLHIPSYFGHLSVQTVAGAQWLFVLGWRDVHAYGPDLTERWVSRDVAVDGVTGGQVKDGVLHVQAEMDPPGGWVAVELDVQTGRELRRALA